MQLLIGIVLILAAVVLIITGRAFAGVVAFVAAGMVSLGACRDGFFMVWRKVCHPSVVIKMFLTAAW